LGAALCGLALAAHGANVLTNPGFELDAAGQSQNLLDWTWYGQSWGNTFNETAPATAHSGNNYFKVFQGFINTVNYNGAYQDVLSGPGAAYTASGWAYTAASDTMGGQNEAWLEVSFRDIAGNILALYRSPVITTNDIGAGRLLPVNTWAKLSVSNSNQSSILVAPANTSFARFQIMFQGDAHNSGGSMYFDDLSLNQVSGESYGNWNIVWGDEFTGATLNSKTWNFDLGAGGWGNNELEYYTSSAQNAYVSNGLLHIVALQQSINGSSYTSARLKSEGLYARQYGRFEWRARLPAGIGFWPALWMLGANIGSAGWPACGEIDVMENSGSDLTHVQGSLHSGSDETQVYTLPEGSVTNFHTYTLDWSSNAISFFVDGIRYQTQTNWSGPAGAFPAPFNQPFFIIMNLAVGGNYVGNPSPSAINGNGGFPGDLQVDYVRVYDITAPLQLSAVTAQANVSISWPTNIVCHLQASASPNGPWQNVLGSANPRLVFPGATTFYRLASP
jgi:beta-glucanase (GH16 family)